MSYTKNYLKTLSVLVVTFALICVNACNETDKAGVGTKKADSVQRIDRSAENNNVISSEQHDSQAKNNHEDSITQTLVNRIRKTLSSEIFSNDLPAMTPEDRKFTIEEMDLNADHKKEVFIGFTGRYHCGSGGCTALLLSHSGSLITKFTVTEYPIVVRPTSTKGWRDLLIGTASVKPSLHLVKWNGKKYPGNPSMQPEFVLVPSEKSVRVFNFNMYDEQWFTF